MNGLLLGLLVLLFVAAGVVVWIAGIQLGSTDVLAVATNLPEIAIAVTAAASGSVDIAVGNILGGIALQTVVLVVLDRFGERAKRARPLTYRAASPALVVGALVVVAVLTVVIAGTQLPTALDLARFTPEGVLIVVV